MIGPLLIHHLLDRGHAEVGDALFLKKHRGDLQGRAKASKAGLSGTMIYAYPYTLARRAVVATFDLSARNLALFRTHH